MKLEGLIAATFTPIDKNGNINTSVIPEMVDRLIANKITGIYICGSTGEGHSLTIDERKELAESFVEAADGRVKVIANVGHNSIYEACDLTRHAASIGVDAISAAPPTYYSINTTGQLVSILEEITSNAPNLPFYYYHIPAMTGVNLDMVEFLEEAGERLPSLSGIKFTAPNIHEFQRCQEFASGKYQILFGLDEMMLSGLTVGANCVIGSTYNFMPAIYHEVMERFQQGDIEGAARCQLEAVNVIDAFLKFNPLPAQKAILRMTGIDCGSVRLPLVDLTSDEEIKLREELNKTDFFNWPIEEGVDKIQVKG